jgi:hypothetical protein
MAKSLEQIKELNLQPGDAIEVNLIFPLKEALDARLLTDNYLGYYIKSDMNNDKDRLYITHSQFMSKFASGNSHVLNHSSLSHYITSFPIFEINTIKKRDLK